MRMRLPLYSYGTAVNKVQKSSEQSNSFCQGLRQIARAVDGPPRPRRGRHTIERLVPRQCFAATTLTSRQRLPAASAAARVATPGNLRILT